MAAEKRTTGQGLVLPARVARKVRALAKSRHVAESQLVLELIERGLRSHEGERETFLAIADAFTKAKDPRVARRFREELARRTFGR